MRTAQITSIICTLYTYTVCYVTTYKLGNRDDVIIWYTLFSVSFSILFFFFPTDLCSFRSGQQRLLADRHGYGRVHGGSRPRLTRPLLRQAGDLPAIPSRRCKFSCLRFDCIRSPVYCVQICTVLLATVVSVLFNDEASLAECIHYYSSSKNIIHATACIQGIHSNSGNSFVISTLEGLFFSVPVVAESV